MAKPKVSPKKVRAVPKATPGAPRGRPKKTRDIPPTDPSSQPSTRGRIKQEAIREGLPATRHWESDNESSSGESEDAISGDFASRWATVELWHSRQAYQIARTLSNDTDNLIPPLVRNLHVHSSLQDVNSWNPPLTTHDALFHYGKNVADALTKAGTLQCLAIDVSLVAAGWLAESAARPLRVALLEDTANPGRSPAMSTCPMIFAKATHVVFEPDWVHLRRFLPHPRTLFPALQYCCIQVDAAPLSVDETVSLVHELLRVRRLEKLVVCMRSNCRREAPVWKALNKLCATEEKLRVLPHHCSLSSEWRAMIRGESAVFNVPSLELQRRVAAMERDVHNDLDPSWHFKPPSMQVALSDAALDRGLSPFVPDRLCTPLPDFQAADVAYAPVIPGMQTAAEDFRDMMQRHTGSQLL